MSAQTMADVFAPVEAKYREAVMNETWGHLAPKKNVTYRGRIVYACGCYESGALNPTVLFSQLRDASGDELDDSPWFFEAVTDWLGQQENAEGCVYSITVSFRNYVFRGKRALIVDANKDGAE